MNGIYKVTDGLPLTDDRLKLTLAELPAALRDVLREIIFEGINVLQEESVIPTDDIECISFSYFSGDDCSLDLMLVISSGQCQKIRINPRPTIDHNAHVLIKVFFKGDEFHWFQKSILADEALLTAILRCFPPTPKEIVPTAEEKVTAKEKFSLRKKILGIFGR